MSTSYKPSPRVLKLDQILSQSPVPVTARGPGSDLGQANLASVPLERIRALTMELQERAAFPQDDLDAITMRILLNEYRAAVAHLRAVANSVDARLHAVSEGVRHGTKVLRREQEMIAKRASREAGHGD